MDSNLAHIILAGFPVEMVENYVTDTFEMNVIVEVVYLGESTKRKSLASDFSGLGIL